MRKRKKFEDDGRTIADMNVEGFRWYEPAEQKANKEKLRGKTTPQERRAMFWSAFRSVALPFVCLIAGGVLAYFICYYVWL